MRKSKWVLHFVKDAEEKCFIRIKVFVGNIFAGSIWGSPDDVLWRVNLFEDLDTTHTTYCFDGKEYKTLNGAKSAVSQWIRRNWSVNLEGEKRDGK